MPFNHVLLAVCHVRLNYNALSGFVAMAFAVHNKAILHRH